VLPAEQRAECGTPGRAGDAGGDGLDEEGQQERGEDSPEEDLGGVVLPGEQAFEGEGGAQMGVELRVPVAGAAHGVVVEVGGGGERELEQEQPDAEQDCAEPDARGHKRLAEEVEDGGVQPEEGCGDGEREDDR